MNKSKWLTCFLLGAVGVHAQSPLLMEQKREMELVLSSAPEDLREAAGAYVLQKNGFVKVRDSRNGFNCVVERRAGHLAPKCYDAEGSTSTLQASLKRGEFLTRGLSPAEVEKRIDEEYRAGRLHAPSKAGIVYMLATDDNYQDQAGKTHYLGAHIMVYAPFLKNADIGVTADQQWSPSHVWVQYEGRPDAYLIFSIGESWKKH
ncbi:MAG: hypothetical protein HYX25_01060 [Candidatus Solibacter usitatus]|nr:hypothetical protein [Candidatus Solibacter usitatus]